jgi:succinyl-CoA:acetate CoA-transferase
MPLPPGLAERLQDPSLHAKVMGADEAAALISVGANVGMSGFTGAAYPKAVP